MKYLNNKMEAVNIKNKPEKFSDHFNPRIIAEPRNS